jgi:predicted esterase
MSSSPHRVVRALVVTAALLAACSGDESPAAGDAAQPDASVNDAVIEDVFTPKDRTTAPQDVPALDQSAPNDTGTPARDVPVVTEASVAHLAGVTCASPVPEGAPRPPPLPTYSSGTCPMLVPGMNTIRTMGGDRRFTLIVPAGHSPSRPSPLLFIWHWLGGSASSVVNNAMAQPIADALGMIVAIPEKKTDLAIRIPIVNQEFDPAWPYLNLASNARVEEEARFFDDVIACVHARYNVNENCISSAGVSAGALWTSQLMQIRSERLASAVILSGGIGPATSTGIIDARGWTRPPRAIPTLLGWGGPIDQCALNFNTASRSLGTRLHMGGHFVEECIHNCGHTVPPVDDQRVGLETLLRFAIDHPYWLRAGESPYLHDGLPRTTPSWCAIGVGRATIRTGMCPSAFMSCPVPAL